jgi:hypothetical protein
MPQFYATDDLQSWIHACNEEQFQSLFEDGDSSAFILQLTKDVKSLRGECQELLRLTGVDVESTLMTALLNTIDYENLLENLQNQFEDELSELKERVLIYDKAAGIDHTDESFSTAVCGMCKTTNDIRLATYQRVDETSYLCGECDCAVSR